MGGKSSAPPAPDYLGAATAQAAASEKATTAQNYANRPTVVTPFGTQSWTTGSMTDPSSGNDVTTWQQNVSLAPGLQSALQSQIDTQKGRSDLASGFMGRVASEYSKPFDWQNLPSAASAGMPAQLQSYVANYSPGLQTDTSSRSNQVQGAFAFNPPPTSSVNPLVSGLSYSTPQSQIAFGLQTQDNPALPQFDTNYRNQVADTLMQRMVPLQERQQKMLETKLSNQGFQQGSEAYKRALDELNMRQAAERYNALDTAGNEAQRLYNMQMGSRQQAFNEDVTGGNFYNQAAQQAFNQGLAANQFGNQAANQAFNQTLAAGQFGNQAQQQLYNQQVGMANLQNQAAGQAFNQDLAANQFRNQALGQASALDIARMNAVNNAASQQFGLNTQAAQFQNQLRQQAIAEQMQRRGMSLNEMNALLSGQQVGMPQFPSFNTAGRAETPQILQATQMGYDAALGAANAQNANSANMMGGLFGLGSSALMSPTASAFLFSDRRLKSNIKRVGDHPIGVGIYEYTMMGMPQRGVIAQEVQAVRPDLVKRHASGYLMVNYKEVGGV